VVKVKTLLTIGLVLT